MCVKGTSEQLRPQRQEESGGQLAGCGVPTGFRCSLLLLQVPSAHSLLPLLQHLALSWLCASSVLALALSHSSFLRQQYFPG